MSIIWKILLVVVALTVVLFPWWSEHLAQKRYEKKHGK